MTVGKRAADLPGKGASEPFFEFAMSDDVVEELTAWDLLGTGGRGGDSEKDGKKDERGEEPFHKKGAMKKTGKIQRKKERRQLTRDVIKDHIMVGRGTEKSPGRTDIRMIKQASQGGLPPRPLFLTGILLYLLLSILLLLPFPLPLDIRQPGMIGCQWRGQDLGRRR